MTMASSGPPGSDAGIEDYIDGSGNLVDPQRTKALKANLHHKIQRTMAQIKDEQNVKEGKIGLREAIHSYRMRREGNSYGSKRHNLQAVELSQRFWQFALQIVSIHPGPGNGGPIYLFFGNPAIWTHWMDATAPQNIGRCRDKSRSDNKTQTGWICGISRCPAFLIFLLFYLILIFLLFCFHLPRAVSK